MNLDFTGHPGFSWYVVLLLFTGVAMVVLSAINVRGQSTGWRIFNVVVGVGFFGYGVYLLLFLQPGQTYLIFFKAFILPVVLIFRWVRGAVSAPPKPAAVPNQSAAGSHPQAAADQGGVAARVAGQPVQQAPVTGQH